MFITNRYDLNIDHFLKYGSVATLAAVAGCSIGIMALFIFYPWSQQGERLSALQSRPALQKTRPAYEMIGTGALSLNNHRSSQVVPNLSHELVLLARNSRPDAQEQEETLLLMIKSTKEKKAIQNGQTSFLEMVPGENEMPPKFRFSDGESPLRIKPIILDSHNVHIEVLMQHCPPGWKTVVSEKGQFVLQDNGVKKNSLDVPYVGALKNAKIWGQDLFLSQYGGEEYESFRDRFKLEMANGSQIDYFYLSQGDTLVFENDRWRMSTSDDITSGKPLARIKSLSAKGTDIEAWDESGFYPFEVKVDLQKPPKMNYRLEEILSSVRLRTATQVSCVIGKRRLILKVGDWLIKTQRGWHKLTRMEEIDDYIQHRVRGELLVIDAIKKEGANHRLMGNLFDSMRTQVQPISLPIIMEKKQTRTTKKRKTPISSVSPARPKIDQEQSKP